MAAVVILPALPETDRRAAAALLYAAFQAKWRYLAGRRSAQLVALLAEALRPDLILAAMADGRLAGVATLGYGGRAAHAATLGACWRALGVLRGPLIWFVLRAMRGHYPPDELHVGMLAVDAAFRRQGIGARLLDAAADRARSLGLAAVRLEVVDTNDAAQRLYARQGYVPIAAHRLPFVPRALGFRGEIVMRRAVR